MTKIKSYTFGTYLRMKNGRHGNSEHVPIILLLDFKCTSYILNIRETIVNFNQFYLYLALRYLTLKLIRRLKSFGCYKNGEKCRIIQM
jgi:hypothetical protein